MLLKVMKLYESARTPTYAHPGDAGMDLYACEEVLIEPGEVALVGTGIAVELPVGTEAQVRPRSGLALQQCVTILNAPGTVDAGYRGEVGVILINHGAAPFRVEAGMKIAQMVIKPVLTVTVKEVSELSDTARGRSGFGSTGDR
jgi:dUTP pyrophosphatase